MDIRLIISSSLEKISKKECEETKKFVLEVLNSLSDQLALRVTVNLMVRKQHEMFLLLREWLKNKNKWVKRLAVTPIPPFIRVKPTMSKACLEFLREAIGWALREISKKDPEQVYLFLKELAEKGNRKS